jgi:hypothetical protein
VSGTRRLIMDGPLGGQKCKQARDASQPSDRPVVVISVLVN